MTGKQRMNTAMLSGRPDHVPFNPQIVWTHAIRQLEKKEDYEECLVKCYTDPNYVSQIVFEMDKVYGSDAFRCIPIYDSSIKFKKEGTRYMAYRRGEAFGYLDTVTGNIAKYDKMEIKTREDVKKIKVPSVDEIYTSEEFDIVKNDCKITKDLYCTIGTVTMPMDFLTSRRTISQALYDLMDDEEMVYEMCEICLESALNRARAYKKTGVDTLMVGDAAASSSLVSPSHFRKFVLPYMRRFCDEIRPLGFILYLHICGNVKPIIDLMPETGAHCFEPMDTMSHMEPREFREAVGEGMSLMGGVDTALLASGTPEQIYEMAGKLIREAGKNGGYIMAAADMVPFEAPGENVMAMSKAAKDHVY